MDALSDIWNQIVEGLGSATSNALPPLVAGLLLLVVGWLAALLGRAIVSALLRRLGVDRLAGKIGVQATLEQFGLDPSASRLLGRIVYWLILLLFVLAAVNRLGMEGVDEALRVGTIHGAYASYEERTKGSITPGKLADLVVLAGDPTRVGPFEIIDIAVERTMVGGRWVFES